MDDVADASTLPLSFHRRILNPPAISLSSSDGRNLFKHSLEQGHLESYFPLSEQYITQSDPAFCGLASLTMSLNSLSIDPRRIWKGNWRWFDDSMLDCCVDHEIVKQKGITLSNVACLANCNGAESEIYFACDMTIDHFRDIVIKIVSQIPIKSVMIISYDRGTVMQTGAGHFSPIGGYNSKEDMVLVMDVARFKYPPHWLPLPLIYQAMCVPDTETKNSRGFVILKKREITTNSFVSSAGKCKETCNSFLAINSISSSYSPPEEAPVIATKIPQNVTSQPEVVQTTHI